MIDSLLMAVHAFVNSVSMSFSVDETVLPGFKYSYQIQMVFKHIYLTQWWDLNKSYNNELKNNAIKELGWVFMAYQPLLVTSCQILFLHIYRRYDL